MVETVSSMVDYLNKANNNTELNRIKFREDCLIENYEGHYKRDPRDFAIGHYFSKKARDNLQDNLELLNDALEGVAQLPASYLENL